MLATVHIKGDDFVPIYNITRKKRFYCNIVDGQKRERLEQTLGIEHLNYNMMIEMNGYCDIDDGDIVEIADVKYDVQYVKNVHDQRLFQKRTDYGNFTGTAYAGLIGGEKIW